MSKNSIKMFLKTFSWCLVVGKLKTEQKLIVPTTVSAIFVLKENGTQSHSAKFLNWGDHVNSVPDLAASPPWLGARPFSAAAPKLWNGLPVELRQATSLNSFKFRLKTYLFKK